MAKRKAQSEHDRMVKYAADYLVSKGYRGVKADVYGYNQPETITVENSHIPDVMGWGTQFEIFEVETVNSIDVAHTASQWTTFAEYARLNNAIFWVVVPKGCLSAAQRRLRALNISAKIWEV